jgi:hypothetical protein
MSIGWNDRGYILDGSSMMFSDVQSLKDEINNLDAVDMVIDTDVPHYVHA